MLHSRPTRHSQKLLSLERCGVWVRVWPRSYPCQAKLLHTWNQQSVSGQAASSFSALNEKIVIICKPGCVVSCLVNDTSP